MPAHNLQKKVKNEVYFHIYNKGFDERKLFNDEADYETFLGYLKDYLTAPAGPEKLKKTFSVNGRTFQGVPHQPKNYFNKVELIAYSLTPNHFRLLVCQKLPGTLEKLIRSLCTRYVIYYNKKYQRTGSLFAGPYKSVQIKDASQLLLLSHYLHREPFGKIGNKALDHKSYSSYEDYLGLRQTSWLKPEVILSYFKKAENNYFKGINGYNALAVPSPPYRNFVEKYELGQNEKKILEEIIIENTAEQFEKITPKIEETKSHHVLNTQPVIEPVSKPRLKVPEFIAVSTIAFVLLFALGVRNVNTSQARIKNSITSSPSPTPQVSGIEDVESEPKKVVIKIDDGAESVNIREKPSTESEKIGKALDGESFELISQEGEWYQIKLEDGSEAFVSERYAEIIEGESR